MTSDPPTPSERDDAVVEALRAFRADVPAAEEQRVAERRARNLVATRHAARRRRVPRRPLAGGIAVAGSTAALVLVLGGGGDGGELAPPSAAAATFDRLARAATANADDPRIGAGDTWYVRTRTAFMTMSAMVDEGGTGRATITPEVREAWFRLRGRGRLLTQVAGPTRTVPAGSLPGPTSTTGGPPAPVAPTITSPDDLPDLDTVPTEKSGGAPQGLVLEEGITVAFGSRGLTLDALRELPTDPGELLARMRRDAGSAGPDPDTEMFTMVGDALRESPVPRTVRVAFLRTIGRIPGVVVGKPMKDAKGREAIPATRGATTYLFDPQDGTLLEERQFGPDGTLIGFATLEASGVVRGVRERVDGPPAPPPPTATAAAAARRSRAARGGGPAGPMRPAPQVPRRGARDAPRRAAAGRGRRDRGSR